MITKRMLKNVKQTSFFGFSVMMGHLFPGGRFNRSLKKYSVFRVDSSDFKPTFYFRGFCCLILNRR